MFSLESQHRTLVQLPKEWVLEIDDWSEDGAYVLWGIKEKQLSAYVHHNTGKTKFTTEEKDAIIAIFQRMIWWTKKPRRIIRLEAPHHA